MAAQPVRPDVVRAYGRARTTAEKGGVLEEFLRGGPSAMDIAEVCGRLLDAEKSPGRLVGLLRLASLRNVSLESDVLLRLITHRDPWVSLSAGDLAVAAGPAGEDALIQAVASLPKLKVPHFAALLGEVDSPRATEALIRLADRPDASDDMRWTAFGTLARRGERSATPAFVRGLRSSRAQVKKAAVSALAAVGDDTATELVLDHLRTRLRRPVSTTAGHALMNAVMNTRFALDERMSMGDFPLAGPLVYLWRHRTSRPDDFGAAARLVDRYWPNIQPDEREWIRTRLPEVLGLPADGVSAAERARQIAALADAFVLPMYGISGMGLELGWSFLRDG